MKNLSAIFALFLLALAAQAALPQPDLIAQIHFAGAQKISAPTNAAALASTASRLLNIQQEADGKQPDEIGRRESGEPECL